MQAKKFIANFRRVKNAWIPRQSRKTVDGKPKGPNATEAKYLREVINPGYNDGQHLISYQPAPIVITRTTKREYTADFLVRQLHTADHKHVLHEVKGSYNLPSQDRARLAWEIAAEAHPEWDFVWAELKRKGWEIERWEAGGRRIFVHLAGWPRGIFEQVEADWRRHKPRKAK